MASGESDELQRRADTRRMWNREATGNSSMVLLYTDGTARSAAVATEQTDDAATAVR
ncbi:hypothetical protein [Geotalea toluenoxydans]|uniref:hypothetical protein n=1 Tax=Geotalea toluenoxydans TaxID=421624 RepID=UPI000AB91C2C|nr:hypothetical protein [Geotalea toluenoxydans]